MSGSQRFGSDTSSQSSISKPQIPPKPSHLHSSVSSQNLVLNPPIGSLCILDERFKDVLPLDQLSGPSPMRDDRAVPPLSNFSLALQDINREPKSVRARKHAPASHTKGANHMSTLEKGQSLKENLSLTVRHGNALENGDQSTIKAVKRQTWESAHTMQKLMRQAENRVTGETLRTRNTEEGLVKEPRMCSPRRVLASSQNAVNTNDHYQQIQATHTSIKGSLNDGLKPVKHLSPTRKLKGRKSTQHLANTNRLVTPQKALALYSFVPEPTAVHQEFKTGGLDKNPPITGFKIGDPLEIWMPDIGGGWSLGKNLANTDYGKARVEDESEPLELIPIGWYRFVGPNEHNKEMLLSDIVPEHGRLHQNSIGPQANRPLWPDNTHASASESTPMKPSVTGWVESSFIEGAANSRRSSCHATSFQLERGKIGRKTVDKSPRGPLSPASVGPSVSLSKEFDPSGIYFERPSRGVPCSVTASDAIYAARQGASVESASAQNPVQNERKFIWNPFLQRSFSGRRSTAQSYIVNGGNLPKDPDHHETCTEKYEIGIGPSWKNPGPLYPVQVHSPELRVHKSTFKAHTSFSITSTFFHDEASAESGTVKLQITVDRRYSHFESMSHGLSLIYGDVVDLPPLPEKRYKGRFNKQFIETRRRGLERYLARLTRNPVLRYCPIVTTFLGCEDEDDFDQQAKQWGLNQSQSPRKELGPDARSSASLSFFSKVFHPDYNADEIDAERSVDAFNRHTKALESGRGVIEVENSLLNVKNGIQELGLQFQLLSSSINNLFGGISLPPVPTHELGNWSDEQVSPSVVHESARLNRAGLCTNGMLDIRKEDNSKGLGSSTSCAGLRNSDGALCWKEECRECLAMAKALQNLGKSLGSVAVIYSKCAEESLAPVQDLLKELSYPHKARQVLSNLHESSKIYVPAGKRFELEDQFESRKETVLNVVMSEVERHHQENNEDFRELAEKLIDSQIKLHEMACEQLKKAKRTFEEPQYSSLALPSPKTSNSGETQLRRSLADHCRQHLSSTHSRSRENSNPILTSNPLGRSSVLEWISGSANDQNRNDIRPRELRQRGNSIESSASTVASSSFSTVFVKPLSAAVASVIDFKQFLYKP